MGLREPSRPALERPTRLQLRGHRDALPTPANSFEQKTNRRGCRPVSSTTNVSQSRNSGKESRCRGWRNGVNSQTVLPWRSLGAVAEVELRNG